MPEVKVGSKSDFPEGKMKKVEANGKEILIANIEGNLYAMNDVCTHEECSLSEGFLEGNTVICPCHNAQFNVTNGNVIEGPVTGEEIKDETSYHIKVEGDDVFISI